MLETENQPVEAIALEVGYEDASFFNRLFRSQGRSYAVAISPTVRIRQTKPAASASVATGSVTGLASAGAGHDASPTLPG
jgi:transcriptional regulator GlxA family with amidase domain